MKAIIKNHKDWHDTGMSHFSTLEGRAARKKDFPVGTTVTIKTAHFYGEKQVYRAYTGLERQFDYFTDNELEIIP